MVFRFSSSQTGTNGPDAILGYAVIQKSCFKNQRKTKQIHAKMVNKDKKKYAKSIIHLPRQLERKVVGMLDLMGLREILGQEITTI